MSLKNYIFSSINTKGAQDSDKFATIRLKSSKRNKMTVAINTDTNGANNAVTPEPQQQSIQTNTTANASDKAKNQNNAGDSKVKRLVKLWSYISVEPLMLCWLLPSCFLFIAVENLALEKVKKY